MMATTAPTTASDPREIMTTPSVTIGWFPRERFELAAESLATLLANSPDCRLIVVDPATPTTYLAEINDVLDGRAVEMISVDHPLLPAESKNLILDLVDTEYVALVENDVLFTEGWLEYLLQACEEEEADVTAPLIIDGRGEKEHFDKHLGTIVESSTEDGKLEIMPIARPRNSAQKRERVHCVEQHVLLFKSEVFDRIGRFDERLNTRDEVDLSMALFDAGCAVMLEPECRIHYVPPTSQPRADELPFYMHRWNLERAQMSREIIRKRWNLVDTPGDLGFVQYRNLIARSPEVRKCLEDVCAESRSTTLLDDGDWFGTEMTEGLELRPFPDLSGLFGGFPASDDAAVVELDRQLDEGVEHILIGYPAYWWMEYLPKFKERMARLPVARCDELMTVHQIR
jgi:GT2 family glycosyltransferase